MCKSREYVCVSLPECMPHLLVFPQLRLNLLDAREFEHQMVQSAQKLGAEGRVKENGWKRHFPPKCSLV